MATVSRFSSRRCIFSRVSVASLRMLLSLPNSSTSISYCSSSILALGFASTSIPFLCRNSTRLLIPTFKFFDTFISLMGIYFFYPLLFFMCEQYLVTIPIAYCRRRYQLRLQGCPPVPLSRRASLRFLQFHCLHHYLIRTQQSLPPLRSR